MLTAKYFSPVALFSHPAPPPASAKAQVGSGLRRQGAETGFEGGSF